LDAGIFDENRYFDIFVEYAKASVEDILIRVTVINRCAEECMLDLLPTIWFRNTWSWGIDARRPRLKRGGPLRNAETIHISHFEMSDRWLLCELSPELLFTDNETNFNGFSERKTTAAM
jgi:hypothetical protein